MVGAARVHGTGARRPAPCCSHCSRPSALAGRSGIVWIAMFGALAIGAGGAGCRAAPAARRRPAGRDGRMDRRGVRRDRDAAHDLRVLRRAADGRRRPSDAARLGVTDRAGLGRRTWSPEAERHHTGCGTGALLFALFAPIGAVSPTGILWITMFGALAISTGVAGATRHRRLGGGRLGVMVGWIGAASRRDRDAAHDLRVLRRAADGRRRPSGAAGVGSTDGAAIRRRDHRTRLSGLGRPPPSQPARATNSPRLAVRPVLRASRPDPRPAPRRRPR